MNASVAKLVPTRVFLALVFCLDFGLHLMNVVITFLNVNPFEDIYFKVSQEAI